MAEDAYRFANSGNLNDASSVNFPIQARESVGPNLSPLVIDDIKDNDFIAAANRFIKDNKEFYNDKYNLTERRDTNEKYRFGRQLKDTKLKKYQARFVDNVIYEAEAYRTPLALTRLPDITVTPGTDSDDSRATAKKLSRVVTGDIQTRERKQVLALAYAHRPVYFVGVVKALWNPKKGKDGDFEFVNIHPNKVVVDHRSTNANVDNMQFLAHTVDWTIKDWCMRFPDKEKEFYQKLAEKGVFTSAEAAATEKASATVITGWEIWFTWFSKAEGPDKSTFKEINGVAWFWEDFLFYKGKDPNWDWEGEQQTFTYKTKVNEENLRNSITTNTPVPGLNTQTVFHNHFDRPHKPFFLMVYDQWGKQPLDETSSIEQVVLLQQNYDKRNRQLTEMIDRSRGKHIFSTASGLTADDIQRLDLDNPDQNIVVNGNANETHAFLPGEQPGEPIFNDIASNRNRIFAVMGVTDSVRGEVNAATTATQTQIAREGVFTRTDDEADDTINACSEWMGNWELQFIKLRYTKDHLVRNEGQDGSVLFDSLNRDLIEDGMTVVISASGVDKLKAEQRAFDMAKLKLVDPFRFYNDIDASDPKGRTLDLMLFTMAPDQYIAKIVNGGDGSSQGLANTLNGSQAGSPQASQDIMQLQSGQIPAVPAQVDPNYLTTLQQYVSSPQFEQDIAQFSQQDPTFKERALQWVEQALQVAQQTAQQAPQPPPGAPPAPGQPAAAVGSPNSPAGPIATTPSPDNTARVAAVPGVA